MAAETDHNVVTINQPTSASTRMTNSRQDRAAAFTSQDGSAPMPGVSGSVMPPSLVRRRHGSRQARGHHRSRRLARSGGSAPGARLPLPMALRTSFRFGLTALSFWPFMPIASEHHLRPARPRAGCATAACRGRARSSWASRRHTSSQPDRPGAGLGPVRGPHRRRHGHRAGARRVPREHAPRADDREDVRAGHRRARAGARHGGGTAAFCRGPSAPSGRRLPALIEAGADIAA